jgi:hypothetical protein
MEEYKSLIPTTRRCRYLADIARQHGRCRNHEIFILHAFGPKTVEIPHTVRQYLHGLAKANGGPQL